MSVVRIQMPLPFNDIDAHVYDDNRDVIKLVQGDNTIYISAIGVQDIFDEVSRL